MKSIKENSTMKPLQKHQVLSFIVVLVAAIFITAIWIMYYRQARQLESEIYLLK